MRRILASPIALLISALMCGTASGPLHAQDAFDFNRDCAKWLEQKGYSTDYIQQKVGARQRGFAQHWQGNVEPKDVQPGDVVIAFVGHKGKNMRVAYVEDVRRDADGNSGAVFVTEWNQGKYTDERCFVTDHFGRLSESKPLTIGTIDRVWRPSLPIKGSAKE
ncbi:MAG: hypothetical protein JWQ73_101 [Variovorax sp.]|nr:hypothetical protein [Variovorax sp.]